MSSSSSGPEQPNGLPPARSMADIARLFLDGARPVPEGGPPKRVGPQERVASVGGEVGGGVPSVPLPNVMLAITGRDGSPQHTERLFAGVHALARERQTSIGVLALENGIFTLDMAGVESIKSLPQMHATGAGGASDLQVAHALYTYRHAAKHWILAAPDPDHPAFAQLAAVVKDWLLVTVTDNESVVAAYRHLKRAMAMSMPERSPQVVLLSNDFADATVVHARLRRATQEFLKNDLPLAMVAKNTHAAALRMAAITVSQPPAPPGVGVPDDTDLHAKIWTTVLDELCGTAVEEEGACKESSESSMPADLTVDQAIAQATQVVAEIAQRATDAEVASRAMYDNLSGLGNVLDDAERTALAVGLDEPEDHTYLAGGLARRSTGEDEKKQERPPLTNDHQSRDCQGATGTIRAMEVTEEETNRKTQWEVVEGSIRDLISESVLLDARPPMSWAKESCVAVDGDGGMHVWTLYKDGVSWFALREWANEHRAILALTRRDLTIEKARAVQVHLVMPLEGGGKEDAKPLLRTETPDVFVYRLRLIQWQGRRGVIVVPIA